MSEINYSITFLDYLLNWATVFVIGILLWKGAVIEGNKARYTHYKVRKDLRSMFKKMKIEDLEKC